MQEIDTNAKEGGEVETRQGVVQGDEPTRERVFHLGRLEKVHGSHDMLGVFHVGCIVWFLGRQRFTGVTPPMGVVLAIHRYPYFVQHPSDP